MTDILTGIVLVVIFIGFIALYAVVFSGDMRE